MAEIKYNIQDMYLEIPRLTNLLSDWAANYPFPDFTVMSEGLMSEEQKNVYTAYKQMYDNMFTLVQNTIDFMKKADTQFADTDKAAGTGMSD